MAVTIPATARRQPTDAANLDESANLGFSIQYKGPFNALETASKAFAQGDVVEDDWCLRAWNLTRSPGGLGVLTLSCAPKMETSEESISTVKKETWSIKSVRNDMSILAYCGPSEGSNPNRYEIEMWMKETDKELVDRFAFKDGKDAEQTLTNLSKAVAEKIAKGVESVIRFYPMIIRKRLYSDVPADQFASLGYIDTPPAAGANAKRPTGLAAVIAAYSWLKVQDDCDEQSDGDWLRTESWMGIKTGDGAWDEDLYGTSRWKMPHGGE